MEKRKFYTVIVVLCLLLFTIILAQKNSASGKKPVVSYEYLLYLPDDYQSKPKKDFPLIIYLHGASLRGSDFNMVKKYGLPHLVDKGWEFDFIIVSPQCPLKKSWESENWFDNLYAEITAKYRVDTNRIYLTGMSLGGFGTWSLAVEYPDKFAAIVPLCGGGRPEKICAISHVPVWAFHGTADAVVPIKRTEELVDKLLKCNGNVKFTRLKDKGHAIQWVYQDKKIYSWMLKHKKAPEGKK
ncbi:MAG: dienelactone hydrolase family protein [Bacteroidales bacterium]|nr:dienelactone hydrolase family protein [Bacteroidales bacterium]